MQRNNMEELATEGESVGLRIRELRLARGYSSEEFAALMEPPISRRYLNYIEAGQKPLTKLLWVQVARALNVRPAAIVAPGYFEREAEAS